MTRPAVLKHIVMCFAALVWAGGAAAQGADSTVYTFDLDTPGGHFSFWRLHDVGRAVRIQASLEITAMRTHDEYGPAFTITLADEGDNAVVVQLQSLDRKPPLRMFMRRLAGEKTRHQVPFKQVIALAKTFQLSLDWSTSNVVVILDGERQSLPRGFTVRSLNVSSSTGDLVAHRLTLHNSSGGR